MKIWTAIVIGIVAITFAAGCGGPTKSGKVLVEVNGEKITEGDLEFLGEINPRIKRQLERPDGRQRILTNLVEQDLLYQKAMKEGLNRDALVKAKVDLYKRVIIAQSLVEKTIDDAAKKYYEENQDQFKKLKLSVIEIKYATPEQMKKAKGKKKKKAHTEEQALALAKEVKAKIDGGMSFEDAAKEYSEDPMTRARGGNMGLVSKDDKRLNARGFAPVLEKAFTMKVGEVAGPIKTTGGYDIITVTRGIELEPFDEAKQSILFRVKANARQDLIASLKKDAKIVYPEEAEKKKDVEKQAAEQEKFKEALKKIQEKKKEEAAEKKPAEGAKAEKPSAEKKAPAPADTKPVAPAEKKAAQ